MGDKLKVAVLYDVWGEEEAPAPEPEKGGQGALLRAPLSAY